MDATEKKHEVETDTTETEHEVEMDATETEHEVEMGATETDHEVEILIGYRWSQQLCSSNIRFFFHEIFFFTNMTAKICK